MSNFLCGGKVKNLQKRNSTYEGYQIYRTGTEESKKSKAKEKSSPPASGLLQSLKNQILPPSLPSKNATTRLRGMRSCLVRVDSLFPSFSSIIIMITMSFLFPDFASKSLLRAVGSSSHSWFGRDAEQTHADHLPDKFDSGIASTVRFCSSWGPPSRTWRGWWCRYFRDPYHRINRA